MSEFLQHIVAIPSAAPNEGKLVDYLKIAFESIGCIVEKQTVEENRCNLFITRGNGSRAILFYGHIDTVDITDKSAWKFDPFTLTSEGEKLYGLGAYDMKGGIAAIYDALVQTDSYVKVFLAVDEEYISTGAWKAIEERKDFFRDVDLIISAEPAFGLGINGLTIGRTGRCIFNLEIKGKPAHIAEYKKGVDAIQILSEKISHLYTRRDEIYKTTSMVVQVRKISAEAVGMSVPGDAHAELEVLLPAGISIPQAQVLLEKEFAQSLLLKQRKTPYLSGYRFSSFKGKDIISSIIETNTGKAMTIHERNSVGDDNVLATLGIPVITWGPTGDNAHAPNEYVNETELKTLTHMYSLCIRQLAG